MIPYFKPSKENVVAFDFDGTLYPLRPYDSEQLLMLYNALGRRKGFEMRAHLAVQMDREGKLPLEQFNRVYRRCINGATAAMIEEDVDTLLSFVQPEAYRCLAKLREHADLVVISCGTTDIARRFMQKLGLEDLFSAYYGKKLTYSDGKVIGFITNVVSTAEKAEVIKILKQRYPQTYAIGDGITDMEMLAESDYGLLMDWNMEGKKSPYPVVTTLEEAVDRFLSQLTVRSALSGQPCSPKANTTIR